MDSKKNIIKPNKRRTNNKKKQRTQTGAGGMSILGKGTRTNTKNKRNP